MKATKKVFLMLLALIMVLSLSVTAFAAGSGTITINDAANGEIYKAYKIFDVTNDGTAYAYTMSADNEWKGDIENFTMKVGEPETDTKVFTLTASASDPDTFIVTWIEQFNTDGAAELAAYLNGKLTANPSGKTADGTSQPAANKTAQITGLDNGYYFVDSSLGALCALNTATPSQTIDEKNSVPELEKKVWEDDSNTWVTNKADIDVIDTIKFQLTVTVGSGVDAAYTITDELPDGLTYKPDSLKVDDVLTTPESTENNSITFTLSLDKLKAATNNTIVITYEATASGLTAGTVYTNKASFKYKEQTIENTAEVVTYEIGGDTKFNKVNEESEKLAGVSFQLSKTEGGETMYAVTDITTLTESATPTLTRWTKNKTEATKLVTDTNGTIKVTGLDSGTYILTETDTLAGYNLLSDTITVVIDDNGNVTYKLTNSTEEAAGSIDVVNTTGTVLPSTGGMGTTVFYMVGSILLVGAAVLLITKKRMSAAQ